jgi:hypothetical protein
MRTRHSDSGRNECRSANIRAVNFSFGSGAPASGRSWQGKVDVGRAAALCVGRLRNNRRCAQKKVTTGIGVLNCSSFNITSDFIVRIMTIIGKWPLYRTPFRSPRQRKRGSHPDGKLDALPHLPTRARRIGAPHGREPRCARKRSAHLCAAVHLHRQGRRRSTTTITATRATSAPVFEGARGIITSTELISAEREVKRLKPRSTRGAPSVHPVSDHCRHVVRARQITSGPTTLW